MPSSSSRPRPRPPRRPRRLRRRSALAVEGASRTVPPAVGASSSVSPKRASGSTSEGSHSRSSAVVTSVCSSAAGSSSSASVSATVAAAASAAAASAARVFADFLRPLAGFSATASAASAASAAGSSTGAGATAGAACGATGAATGAGAGSAAGWRKESVSLASAGSAPALSAKTPGRACSMSARPLGFLTSCWRRACMVSSGVLPTWLRRERRIAFSVIFL